MEYLQDDKGNKSSKRLFGTVLCSVAIVMHICLFIFSLYHTVADTSTAFNVSLSLLTAGLGLFGITGIEKIMVKKDAE